MFTGWAAALVKAIDPSPKLWWVHPFSQFCPDLRQIGGSERQTWVLIVAAHCVAFPSSIRRPASVIRTRAISISCLPARIRSAPALASRACTNSTICATVKPCASIIASGAAVAAGGEQFERSAAVGFEAAAEDRGIWRVGLLGPGGETTR